MNVRHLYNELLLTSFILNFFDAFLTSLAAFSVSYFFLYFYRLPFWVAIAVGGAFFIRSFWRKAVQNKISVIEREYPNLRERLRTSYDYKDSHNTVIDSLHSDIMSLMEKVDINAYLNPKKVSVKIILTCVMLFSVLYMSSAGFDILDVRMKIVNSAIYKDIESTARDLFDTRDETKDRPKLDDPRLAALGNKNMSIDIDTYNTELDVNQIDKPEKNDYGGHYPEEVQGAAQEVYQEDIPEEYKDTIKDYFNKIND
jgi:hypothetical protein